MYGKLLVILALSALSFAREYPAGLHPAVCPDYPNCAPDVLARFTPEGIPIPQWGLYPGLARAAPEYPAGVDHAQRYPAGVDPALCPNYPYCW